MSEQGTYEGWKNYDTWNISLWLNNTEPIYCKAVEFMQENPKRDNPYIGFLLINYMTHLVTPDYVEWLSDKLDFPALDEMMKELIV